jgi:DNA-binding NarL/FixJ family response regulator
MAILSLVLADDHLLFCESLRTVLEAETDDIRVLGIAKTGLEALALVERYRPDMVLMDVRMPQMDGVEAARLVHERFPDTLVMMLTTFDDDEYVREAVKYGAVGYLLKDTPLDQLIMAIRDTKNGVMMISTSVAKRLASDASANADARLSSVLPDWVSFLSRREKEILHLFAQGLDNVEIATKLFIAEQTVKNHISDVYFKLGVHDRGKVMRMLSNLPRDILLC